MDIGPGVTVEDELVLRLVGCGREAHDIARAHHNDPGSNGHTFGLDRYQRGTELAKGPLREYGFQVKRRGAGLLARRDDLELQFAVARGDDLNDPSDFDADSSPVAGGQGMPMLASWFWMVCPPSSPRRSSTWCGVAPSRMA